MKTDNFTTLEDDSFDRSVSSQKIKQKLSTKIFVTSIIILTISIIGLASILLNFSNLINMNYPTDSFGNVCHNIHSNDNNQIQFSYVYLNVQTNKIVRYCISECPTIDATFNNENIYAYNSQTQQSNSYQYLKYRHSNHFSLNHRFYHTASTLNINSQSQEKPYLGGVCLSQNKLKKIQQIDNQLYLQIKQKTLLQKFIMWSFIIILVISFLSIFFNLLTKTNLLVNSFNDPTYYNLDRNSAKHSMDIIMTIIFAIIGLITILIIGLAIIFEYISNKQNVEPENEAFIRSENQFLLLLSVTILSLFLLAYLFYNLISRHKNAINLSATFIRYSEQYVKKVEYVLFSVAAAFLSLLCFAVLFCIWLSIISNSKQVYQKNKLFLQKKTQNQYFLVLLFLLFSYFIFNLLQQAYLYSATYKAFSELLQSQKDVSFLNCKDVGYIFKISLILTFFSFPIKLVSSLNVVNVLFQLNFQQNQQNSSCFLFFYRRLFCLCGWMINKFHQLSLNNYLLYIPQKFQMIKIYPNNNFVQMQTKDQLNYGRYMRYIYQIYKNNQRSSLYVYQLSQWLLKGVGTLIISFIMQYCLNDSLYEDSSYFLSFTMAILTAFLVSQTSSFSTNYLFAFAQVVQFKLILLKSNFIRQNIK